MKIIFKKVNTSLHIWLSGELDECASKMVREKLDAIIEFENPKKVIIDMSNLEFMDSTGVGVLLGRFKKLQEKSIPLIIANPSRVVDKLLNLTGIYKYMPKIEF